MNALEVMSALEIILAACSELDVPPHRLKFDTFMAFSTLGAHNSYYLMDANNDQFYIEFDVDQGFMLLRKAGLPSKVFTLADPDVHAQVRDYLDLFRQLVSQVAYELWEQRGRLDGYADKDWHEAIAIVRIRLGIGKALI